LGDKYEKDKNRKGGKEAVLEFGPESRNSELLVAVKARQSGESVCLKRSPIRINFIGCRKKLEIMY